ncbi:MAG: thioredoxin family protein, partial [Archaeoglobaceae archaeon]
MRLYVLAAIAGVLTAVVGSYIYESQTQLTVGKIYFFYSDYCPHCAEVKPYVEEVASKYDITFCNVANMSDECLSIAEKLQVKYVPTIAVV